MTSLHLELSENGYDINIGHGLLSRAGELFDLQRKVAIITDSGVPSEYARGVAECAREAIIITVPMGEGSKSLDTFGEVMSRLVEFGMTRSDCLVAVGGGVVGDLTGYAAASYMRGIDFYNVPTTVLSQIDSSIGGKCAVNHSGVKNIIGAFYQPKGVLIDLDTQKTLPKRQITNGLAEAVKMAVTFDKELFCKLECTNFDFGVPEEIVASALAIKKKVVELDERESGIRRALNFGHTFGHAVEAKEEMSGIFHGECVAMGMMPMCSPEVKARLGALLTRFGLPTEYNGDARAAMEFVMHDKKCEGSLINAVLCDEIGSFKIVKMSEKEFGERILK